MAHPLKHAQSSAKKFDGKVEDYLPIHNWFDESKAFLSDFRHRPLRHHAEGIFLCEKLFGVAIKNSDGKQVPVRYVGEQHVKEDLGRIPTAQVSVGPGDVHSGRAQGSEKQPYASIAAPPASSVPAVRQRSHLRLFLAQRFVSHLAASHLKMFQRASGLP